MGTKWKCINCGETRNISMIPSRLSDYLNEWEQDIHSEDILIYRPKYSVTPRLTESSETGKCYCSYRCFTNPIKLRSNL